MLAARIAWLEPIYEAALDRGPEWPPHPGRLFCALVAAACSSPEDTGADASQLLEGSAAEALRWLEAQPPPTVHFPDSQRAPSLTSYVPTNDVGATKSNRIARTSGERSWHRSHLRTPVAVFCWPGTPDAPTLGTLRQLARRVPYLGRSTSLCTVDFDLADTAPVELEELLPAPRGGDVRLRVPYEGHLDALRGAFEEGQPARTVDRWTFYARRDAQGGDRDADARAQEGPGAYEDLLTLGFGRGVALDGRLVLRVASAFKAAVLQRLGEQGYGHSSEELALLHGHHDGTRRQCAFLVLPFVGRTGGSGALLGVGIAVSHHLPQPVRRSLLLLLGYDQDHPRLERLYVPGLAECALHHPDGRYTLEPTRWTGPSSSWSTVLPLALDRYPDSSQAAPAIVARCCENAGYPLPDAIEVLGSSPVPGVAWLRKDDLRRKGEPLRPFVHARIHFPRPVQGPVVIGRLRHLGLGLCVPLRESEQGGTDQ
ncbi:MAG TPA: type I-U CRISPR-associated protein Csb2 [Acidimicrobiales bacterium]|nr:type I-U CRISPR-associated protein Csb2 [Acidimicrobiales bacterium]